MTFGAAKFQVNVKEEWGRGSDLNVQLTLSGGKVNMSTQAAQTHIAREGCNVFYIP